MAIRSRTTRALQLYYASFLLYTLAILLFRYSPYYSNLLYQETQATLLCLYLGFITLSPFYYYFTTQSYSTNKPLLLFQALQSIIKNKPLYHNEKTAILFILVKLFFLPLMLNFFFQNLAHLIYLTHNFFLYPFLLTTIFTIDTLIFSFGYTFEFRSLNNTVRSVEPTLLGWIVALISYPPFNDIVGKYVSWGADNLAVFGSVPTTNFIRTILIALLTVYLWASFALGTKASNLTNRGIVTTFPYSIVRHPAYISKNLVWWITLLPFMSWKFALGLGFWSFIYVLRAITEERHLLKDSEYQEYCKKVRYRFIPYIF